MGKPTPKGQNSLTLVSRLQDMTERWKELHEYLQIFRHVILQRIEITKKSETDQFQSLNKSSYL